MFSACFLSFAMGFLSLGQEILWIRLFGFANHSLPQAFAFVLTVYLIGIAVGAHIGKKICGGKNNLWLISGRILLLASIFDLISPWLYATFSITQKQIFIGGILILSTAVFKAIIFPIAHHLGASNTGPRVGVSISKVYVSNILGATLGPLIIGIVLLDLFTTQQCFIICAGLTFGMSVYCLRSKLSLIRSISAIGIVFSALGWLMFCEPSLLIALVARTNLPLNRIVETPQGIIASYHGGKSGDAILGGNVYDGTTNLDPIINSNGINRVIILSALQKKPERVLMIGLSIGTWLKIVTSFPDIKHIDVIEINPGYLKLMQDYPRQLSALSDPRVSLYIDDGRRWLKSHPNDNYDLVIMNTTYYWRMYTSNLLSKEFLEMIKQHMRPHAVFAYNTTSSPDALKTAASVFPYAYRYMNFAIAADFDWRQELKNNKNIKWLSALRLDNKKLFPSGTQKIQQFYLAIPTPSSNDIQKSYANLRPIEVITDNNLITEYKYGYSLGYIH